MIPPDQIAWINHAVDMGIRRWGGDRAEALSDAALAWIEQRGRHDPKRGTSLKTWAFVVTFRSFRRRRDRWARLAARRRELRPDHPAKGPRFTPETFAAGLTPDAAEVVRLAVDPPRELAQRIARRDEQERTKARRRCLVEFLAEMGWAAARIAESFREIGDALSK